ncbi:MAG: hypothetical protein EBY07_13180 [Actinobacteria bacterium]|nr:hypothetical protein [Actinomycetota bacterium]
MRTFRNTLCAVFVIIALLSALAVWVAYVTVWYRWQGVFGALIGLFTSPGFVIFPFIYWVVENSFPVNYFILWGISMAAWLLAGLAFTED